MVLEGFGAVSSWVWLRSCKSITITPSSVDSPSVGSLYSGVYPTTSISGLWIVISSAGACSITRLDLSRVVLLLVSP